MLDKKSIFKVLLLSVGIKVLYYLFALFISRYEEKVPNIDFYSFEDSDQKVSCLKIFLYHDAGWYKLLATEGHHKISKEDLGPKPGKWQQSYYGFFPFYPILVGLTIKLLPVSYPIAAFIWSMILSFLCFYLFYLFALRYFNGNQSKAYYSLLILAFFPFNFYFSMFMPEALFLSLLLLCFFAIEKENKLLLIIAGSFLVLTRSIGVFMSIPLLAYYFEKSERKKGFSIKHYFPLEFLVFPITFLAYCYYLKYMTGDFYAYATAQKLGWNKEFQFPFKSLFNDMNDIRMVFQSCYCLFFMLISLLNVKRFSLSFQLLIWVSLLLPLIGGNPSSMTRYISVIFPFWLLFGNLISKISYRYLIFFGLICLHLLSYYWLLTGDPLTY